MFRSTRRFSSSYVAITISIATNADGTAASARNPSSSALAVPRRSTPRKIVSRSAAHAKNEIASIRSASVSCLRLSIQKIVPTARYKQIDGITTGTIVNQPSAFAAAHTPSATAATPAADFHTFRCE